MPFLRILNDNGADWIKQIKDQGTYFQLDTFRRNKTIKEYIPYVVVRNEVHNYFHKKDVDVLLAYLLDCMNKLSYENEIKQAENILNYFVNNKEGLVPYW